MRSVVVVLPASMCALMPMFRYRSIGVVRGTCVQPISDRSVVTAASAHSRPVVALFSFVLRFSEAEVAERLVGFRHAVHFLALLDRAAAAFRGLHQLGGKALAH